MQTVPASLSWPAHPARERRLATAATLSTLVFAGFSGGLLSQQPAWSLLAAALLTWLLRRDLFPIEFPIDARVITLTIWFDHRFGGWAEVLHGQADHHSTPMADRRKAAGWLKGRPLELPLVLQRAAAWKTAKFHVGRDGVFGHIHTPPGLPGEFPACVG